MTRIDDTVVFGIFREKLCCRGFRMCGWCGCDEGICRNSWFSHIERLITFKALFAVSFHVVSFFSWRYCKYWYCIIGIGCIVLVVRYLRSGVCSWDSIPYLGTTSTSSWERRRSYCVSSPDASRRLHIQQNASWSVLILNCVPLKYGLSNCMVIAPAKNSFVRCCRRASHCSKTWTNNHSDCLG